MSTNIKSEGFSADLSYYSDGYDIDLNRAFERIGALLKANEYNRVIKICTHVVQSGYEIPEFYQVMLLAQSQCKDLNGLKNSRIPLDSCECYDKVISLSDKNTVAYLKKCNEISHRNQSINSGLSNKPDFLNIDIPETDDYDINISNQKNSAGNKNILIALVTLLSIAAIVTAFTFVIKGVGGTGEFSLFKKTLNDPKTCVHTTNHGMCDDCGLNLDTVHTINDEISSAVDSLSSALDWIKSAEDNTYFESSFLSVAKGDFFNAQLNLSHAIGACGNDENFSNIKKNLNRAKDALDVSYSDRVLKYSNAGRDCLGYLQYVMDELNAYSKDL